MKKNRELPKLWGQVRLERSPLREGGVEEGGGFNMSVFFQQQTEAEKTAMMDISTNVLIL